MFSIRTSKNRAIEVELEDILPKGVTIFDTIDIKEEFLSDYRLHNKNTFKLYLKNNLIGIFTKSSRGFTPNTKKGLNIFIVGPELYYNNITQTFKIRTSAPQRLFLKYSNSFNKKYNLIYISDKKDNSLTVYDDYDLISINDVDHYLEFKKSGSVFEYSTKNRRSNQNRKPVSIPVIEKKPLKRYETKIFVD